MIPETSRLTMREATAADAAFILDLLNAPGFIQGIGDRGVRTLDQARDYIETRMISSYREHGFGMWVVAAKGEAAPAGLC
ncbi:MAG: GNAT family N-acetyltransferase, partial [Alphaproteobacteria bacterium]|nr:GNAT family N-acetyltransferase [Alphaproteobacteria bacterium]